MHVLYSRNFSRRNWPSVAMSLYKCGNTVGMKTQEDHPTEIRNCDKERLEDYSTSVTWSGHKYLYDVLIFLYHNISVAA